MLFLLELSNAMILKKKQHKTIKSRLSTTFAHEFLVLKTLLYLICVNWRSRRSFCKCVLKTIPIPLFSQAIFTSVFAVSDGRPFEPTQIKIFYVLVFYIHIYAWIYISYLEISTLKTYTSIKQFIIKYRYCKNQRRFLCWFIFYSFSLW